MSTLHVVYRRAVGVDCPVAAFSDESAAVLCIAHLPRKEGVWHEIGTLPLDPGPEVDL